MTSCLPRRLSGSSFNVLLGKASASSRKSLMSGLPGSQMNKATMSSKSPYQASWSFSDDMNAMLYPVMSMGSLVQNRRFELVLHHRPEAANHSDTSRVPLINLFFA